MRSDTVECGIRWKTERIEGMFMTTQHILFNILHGPVSAGRNSARKIIADHFITETQCLENLCGLIGLQGGNTHLGRDLRDAVTDCRIIVFNCGVIILVENTEVDHFHDAFLRKIWIDGFCAKSEQRGAVMDCAWITAFHDQ